MYVLHIYSIFGMMPINRILGIWNLQIEKYKETHQNIKKFMVVVF